MALLVTSRRRWLLGGAAASAAAGLAAPRLAGIGSAVAQQRQQQPAPAPAPPPPQGGGGGGRQQPLHAWLFGAWTGGIYPPIDNQGPACFGQPTVIFTRDVVMRVSSLEVAYRQRLVQTVAGHADGSLEFRFVPLPGVGGGFGGRVPPDIGFGCANNPNLLRVERRGPDEIAFTDCAEFPSPLRRCVPEQS